MRKIFLTLFSFLLVAGCATYNLKVHENNASLYIEDQLFKKIRIDTSFQYVGAVAETLPNGVQGKRYQFIKSNTEAINIFCVQNQNTIY